MSTLPEVEISSRAARQIAHGRLWVYSNEVRMEGAPKEPGTWCRFTSGAHIVGTGYFNRHSLIAGRIVSTEQTDDIPALLRRRLSLACSRRKAMLQYGAVRMVFSEADLLPGLIVDLYSTAVVIQSNTAGMDAVLPVVEKLLPEVLRQIGAESIEAMSVRADSSIRHLEGVENQRRICFGDEAKIRNWVVREDDVLYSADLLEGQKTGFFLDQRENRRFLGRLAKEAASAKVLDLYCYSGGWGIHSLFSGAAHVTFVDQSQDALGRVEKGLLLNSIPAERAVTRREDVFDLLASNREQFDIIIADPPSFAKSVKVLPQALRAYEKLNRMCWRCLKPEGIMLSCSCDYHVANEAFVEMLQAAIGKEAGLGQIIYRGNQAQDHPILLSMAETGYLKCLGIRKLR